MVMAVAVGVAGTQRGADGRGVGMLAGAVFGVISTPSDLMLAVFGRAHAHPFSGSEDWCAVLVFAVSFNAAGGARGKLVGDYAGYCEGAACACLALRATITVARTDEGVWLLYFE